MGLDWWVLCQFTLLGGMCPRTETVQNKAFVAYFQNPAQFSEIAPMQQERYGHSTLCIDGAVHVFGGYESTSNQAEPDSLYTAEKYKTSQKKWIDIPEMPIPTAFAGACLMDDSIVYLFGGI